MIMEIIFKVPLEQTYFIKAKIILNFEIRLNLHKNYTVFSSSKLTLDEVSYTVPYKTVE